MGRPLEKNIFTTAVCFSLLAVTSNANALILSADANVQANTVINPQVVDVDANSVNATNSAYQGVHSSRAAGKGRDDGWMYSYAGGSGIFESQGHIKQRIDFTNDTGEAQNYFYDFTINFGSLTANSYEPLAAGDFVKAGNDVSITLNNVEIFASSAELTKTSTGSGLIANGAFLGSYSANSDYYSWDSYAGTLDLGVFDIGDSFFLEYDIFTNASSNVAASTCVGEDGGDDELEFEIRTTNTLVNYECATNYGYSHFGDPNSISGIPQAPTAMANNLYSSPASAVPEPSSLFLLGGGALGFAFTRRRQKTNA